MITNIHGRWKGILNHQNIVKERVWWEKTKMTSCFNNPHTNCRKYNVSDTNHPNNDPWFDFGCAQAFLCRIYIIEACQNVLPLMLVRKFRTSTWIFFYFYLPSVRLPPNMRVIQGMVPSLQQSVFTFRYLKLLNLNGTIVSRKIEIHTQVIWWSLGSLLEGLLNQLSGFSKM